MKARLMSLFYLLIFLITKIILWFQKPKTRTVRIFPESSRPWNIFYPVTSIGKQIFLGSCVQASNRVFLENNKITHIVNVSMEIPNFYSSQFDYFNLRIQDNGLESFKKIDLEQVYQFIDQAVRVQKQRILIHCYSGRSRSVTVLIYYLHVRFGLSIEICIRYLKQKRKIINPSSIFYQNLKSVTSKK